MNTRKYKGEKIQYHVMKEISTQIGDIYMSQKTSFFIYTFLSTVRQIMKTTEALWQKKTESYEKNIAREKEILCHKMDQGFVFNGKQIQNFYTDVLATMIVKLIKEYRFTKKIHQDEILDIQKVVKQKLSNQRSKGLNPIFTTIRQVKEQMKEQFSYISQQNLQQSNPKPKQSVISNVKQEALEDITYKHEIGKPAQEDEEYLDDLADYIIAEDSMHKKEEAAPVFLKEQAHIYFECKEEVILKEDRCKQSQPEYQTIDEEQEKEQRYNAEIEAKIGTSILGSFQSFQVKRLSKEEKILLNLQNVFVKFSNGKPETFFSSLSIALTKVEKGTIKEINN